MIGKLILIAFMAVVALSIGAFKLLGLWAIVVVPVALLLTLGIGTKLFGERIFTRILSAPFKAKGAALRDATVEIHDVRAAAEPIAPEAGEHEDADDSDEPAPEPVPGMRYYWLDATIQPSPSAPGPFSHWEPGELLLVKPGTDPMKDGDDDGDAPCTILRVRVAEDGTLQDDEGMKYPGRQRLELGIGVHPGVNELQFQYYFETFGRVVLPA